ncbi:GNAT family N-acetyltransferase [Demequina sp.]|uniref:GNAT family N-acetyltransferase n=1 Tax=Demequina sp. TaxID=2050685 RepID=UPI003D103CD6
MRFPLPVLRDGIVEVRPLRRTDELAWLDVRAANRGWLKPWEATIPTGVPQEPVTFPAFVRQERRAWRKGEAFGAVVLVDGLLVGRASIGGIRWGAERGGSVGYWISQDYAGHGYTPRAVQLLVDYGFAQGLHRLEIAVRPENESSLAVVRKLGFADEGMRRSYLFIDGDWRDHRVFARTAD